MAKSIETAKIPTRVVRLEVFDLHGHNGDQALDYGAFFRAVAALPPSARREEVADRIIAVPMLTETGGIYTFNAYIGSSDSSFLVLDLVNNVEQVRQLGQGELLATRTVGVIDPIRRLAIIQYVHTGVRAAQIAALFEKLAVQRLPSFAGATLEFALRAGTSFREQLAELDRIQSASVTITRPNIDWTDFSDAVNEVAGDSNARNIEVSASAPRNDTLRKNRGLVQLIRELSRPGARSIMKSAVVKGTASETGEPMEVKLNKNVEATQVRVTLEGGLPDPQAVANAANDVLTQFNADAS